MDKNKNSNRNNFALKMKQREQQRLQKEIDKKMDKEVDENWYVLKEVDFEEKTGKTLVAIETKEQLESAVAFVQYLFKDIHLITIIAEKHTNTFLCEKPSMTIAEYCKKKILDNSNCKILLEYNKKNDPLTIGSHSINSVFTELKSINKIDHIIPIDIRADFITSNLQNVLYDNDNNFNMYTYKEIGEKFIDPFFKNQKLFDLEQPMLYDEKIKKFMFTDYFQDIVNSFYYTAAMLRNQEDRKIIKLILKDIWKKVMDYFILGYILKNDDIDEYIIIVGDAHYNNIKTVLYGDIFTQLNEQNGKKSSDCVKLFQTLKI